MRKKIRIFLFIVPILNACLPTPASEKQKKDKMKSAYFNPNIIMNIDKYESLKNFLENNIDTIIKFRYSKNIASLYRGNGQSDSNYLADDYCYSFIQGNNPDNIMNVPENLKRKLESSFYSLDEKDIFSYEVCKDKKISITISCEGDENGLYISHNLIWDKQRNMNYYKYHKDTLIKSNCIYRIEMFEYQGH
jgi:hypothetical protein